MCNILHCIHKQSLVNVELCDATLMRTPSQQCPVYREHGPHIPVNDSCELCQAVLDVLHGSALLQDDLVAASGYDIDILEAEAGQAERAKAEETVDKDECSKRGSKDTLNEDEFEFESESATHEEDETDAGTEAGRIQRTESAKEKEEIEGEGEEEEKEKAEGNDEGQGEEEDEKAGERARIR